MIVDIFLPLFCRMNDDYLPVSPLYHFFSSVGESCGVCWSISSH